MGAADFILSLYSCMSSVITQSIEEFLLSVLFEESISICQLKNLAENIRLNEN